MNEDTFTVQVMDTSERVHSFDKKTLKSFRHENRSLMPVYDANRVSATPTSTTCWRTCRRCARIVGEEGRIAMRTVRALAGRARCCVCGGHPPLGAGHAPSGW